MCAAAELRESHPEVGVVVLGEALKVTDPRTVALLAVAVAAMVAATIALGHDEGAFEEMLEAEMARRAEAEAKAERST